MADKRTDIISPTEIVDEMLLSDIANVEFEELEAGLEELEAELEEVEAGLEEVEAGLEEASLENKLMDAKLLSNKHDTLKF